MTIIMYYNKTCEQCGKEFRAQKSNTRFCSKYCADAAYKDKMRQMTQNLFSAQSNKDKELRTARDIMSPRLLGEYLGVSRRTAYRYIEDGIVPSVRTNGRTLVRRADVDKLFDNAPPYQKSARKPKDGENTSNGWKITSALSLQTESGYTTVKEVAEKYSLSPAGTDKILKNSGITVVKHQGKHYYFKSEVEALFRKREAESHPEIKEWYTSAEVQEKFGLKATTVYDIVSTYRIPSKKVHRVTYYSKIHFDAARGLREPLSKEWYTVQEAMEKYGQTRNQVYNVLRYNHIERVQDGKHVKFRRSDYDRIMEFNI